MSNINLPVFAQNSLDRMDFRRASVNPAAAAHHRYIGFHDGNVVYRRRDKQAFLSAEDMAHIPHEKDQAVFLGGKDATHFFAFIVTGAIGTDYETIDVRSFALQQFLPDEDVGIIAEASAVLNWHKTHGFCACCGARTRMSHAGWRRDCTACAKQHFPRIDPVVIMLVTHGDECLLGAGVNFQDPTRYSCLAGFMEPGETIEAAARRELFEEAGVIGGRVVYKYSQPWPFPTNLMIGVHVEAGNKTLRIDTKELRDAKWVTRDHLKAVLNGATDQGFSLPPRIAIAYNLLAEWATLP